MQVSGFETRQDELRRQADLFAELDSALVMFYKAVSDLGMAESVTVYTDTEFNRTLTPNKTGGSLHAWGGHQLVLGGSVLGGRIYGTVPIARSGRRGRRVGQWHLGAFDIQRAVCRHAGILVRKDRSDGRAGVCGLLPCGPGSPGFHGALGAQTGRDAIPPQATSLPHNGECMAIQDFLTIRTAVLSDAALQEQLRAAPDEAALFERVLALGREHGCDLSEQDLRFVVDTNRRNWLERWLHQ